MFANSQVIAVTAGTRAIAAVRAAARRVTIDDGVAWALDTMRTIIASSCGTW